MSDHGERKLRAGLEGGAGLPLVFPAGLPPAGFEDLERETRKIATELNTIHGLCANLEDTYDLAQLMVSRGIRKLGAVVLALALAGCQLPTGPESQDAAVAYRCVSSVGPVLDFVRDGCAGVCRCARGNP